MAGLRVLTVLGARPQFIKAAEVTRSLSARNVQETIVHTGQHYDHLMSQVFFDELGVSPPAFHLGVGSGSHGMQTGRILEKIEEVCIKTAPEGVIVYGDTNSTLAGALAAAKLNIPVFHVEAGLRSFNPRMPEEVNRVMTDHLSSMLFCPNQTAVENLQREGMPQERIVLSGDVMRDSVERHAAWAQMGEEHIVLSRAGSVLVTIHRAENTDDGSRLAAIVDALCVLSNYRPVFFPIHPRTRAALETNGLLARLADHVSCAQPLGYRQMITAQTQASLIITDSGGVQKEAFFLGKPCVIVRPETEWVEIIEQGGATLVEPEAIVEASKGIPPQAKLMDPEIGVGTRASDCVSDAIVRFLS